MPTAKERLTHLLALASEGPAQRAALVGELADLVLDWPSDYPGAMRPPVMALFEMTVRETDDKTRAELAPRLGGHSELPLHLLNEFFLCAPARLRREVLTRNALSEDDAATAQPSQTPDAAGLVDAARRANTSDFAQTASVALGIAAATLRTILADDSAEALAILCKGARLDRAAFSALALLKANNEGDPVTRLLAYDTIPQRAADRLTAHWRAQADQATAEHAQAAE